MRSRERMQRSVHAITMHAHAFLSRGNGSAATVRGGVGMPYTIRKPNMPAGLVVRGRISYTDQLHPWSLLRAWLQQRDTLCHGIVLQLAVRANGMRDAIILSRRRHRTNPMSRRHRVRIAKHLDPVRPHVLLSRRHHHAVAMPGGISVHNAVTDRSVQPIPALPPRHRSSRAVPTWVLLRQHLHRGTMPRIHVLLPGIHSPDTVPTGNNLREWVVGTNRMSDRPFLFAS